MFKYNRNTLQRIEQLLVEQEFIIRYERGSFKSGYCLVENKKIVVINKYFDLESRINCLLEIISQIEIDPLLFSISSNKYFKKLEGNLDTQVKNRAQTSFAF
jgi:hypothetical protein